MTIRDYFAAKRDQNGLAWIDDSTWIDERNGVLRLNSALGVVLLPPDEDVEWAQAQIRQHEAQAQGAAKFNVPSQFDDALDPPNRVLADQFDDYSAAGGWPGLSADDAEPGDFEDSVGDLYEDED